MGFLQRLLGRQQDAGAAARSGAVPAPAKQRQQAPLNGQLGLEPPLAIKATQAGVVPAAPEDSDDENDCIIRVPGSIACPAERGSRSNSIARRRAAIDISPRAVKRFADKVAVLEASSLRASLDGDACGITHAEVEALYTDMQLIHRGRSSMVYRAREVRSGRRVILKAYDSTRINPTRRAALDRQVLTLRAAQAGLAPTCSLVLLERVVENPSGTYLVMQACNGGTLIEAIANAGGKLPERQVAVKVALPLLGALSQLHARGIVHRDLKPEHLMIHNGSIKIGDFGSAGCMTTAAAALASSLQRQARLQQQQAAARTEQRRRSSHLMLDQPPLDLLQQPEAAAQDQPEQQLAHPQQQCFALQATCTAASQAGPDAGCCGRCVGSAARLGCLTGDTLSGQVSGPLSPVAMRDAMNFRAGSLEYMAPEVLSKPTPAEVFHLVIAQGIDEDDLPVYDEKADVWSLGVVLYEALSGLQPFLADTAADMAAAIRAKLAQPAGDGHEQQQEQQALPPLPAFIARLPVARDAQELVAACLTWDPAARPSAAELLSHPWLQRMQAEAASVAASRACSRRMSMQRQVSAATDAAPAAACAAAGALAAADAQAARAGSSLLDPLLADSLLALPEALDPACASGLERSYTSEQLEVGVRHVLRTNTQRLESRPQLQRVHAA